MSTPPNQLTRGVKPDWMKGSGPYIGRVVNHLDPEYMGSIEVEILKITESGNAEESSGFLVPCKYLSPFYGVTPRAGVTENDGYDYTQKSYGMWAIPPDVGVKVMVIFVEGNYGYGYWMGCIQDNFMNFMVPGNASTSYNDLDKSKALPVGEFNKVKETGAGRDPTQYIKPHAKDQYDQLTAQGLTVDTIRGITSSSARRETPSMVFGWSTPGPYDRRPGKPKAKYGEKLAQSDIPFSRLGGSSIVMDDGDASLVRKTKASAGGSEYANVEQGEKGDVTVPANELLRLRTRTGHQILLHNSEDLIYIAHGSGNSWIEMTANGKIDIYAADSVSIHSNNDFNFKADRDINIEAGNDINVSAGAKINQTSTADLNIKSGAGLNTESSGAYNIKSGAAMNIESSSAFNIKSGAVLALGSAANFEVTAGADGVITASGSNNLASSAHKITAGAISFNGAPASTAGSPGGAGSAEEAKKPTRLPEHEPWGGHESGDPTQHTPDKTISGGTAPTSTGATPIRDTFRKNQ